MKIELSLNLNYNLKTFFGIITLIFFCGLIPHVFAVEFLEVTEFANISYSGPSWGASWGDFNGDGFPDLWTNGHRPILSLYQNNGNGTFTDIAKKIGLDNKIKDPHAASWADFDNDGDQDIIVLTGAERGLGDGPNYVFVNKDGMLQDNAAELGLDFPFGRGRTPLWLDWNEDGKLDILLNNSPRPDGKAPTSLFNQTLDGFKDITNSTGLTFSSHVSSAQISDLSNDGKMKLVFMTPVTEGVFDLNEKPFKNIQSELNIPTIWSRDLAISDFNGDLLPDIFLARKEVVRTVIVQDELYKIKAHHVIRGEEIGFNFKNQGNVSFEIYPLSPPEVKIFVGSKGIEFEENKFTLSSDDSVVLGIFDDIGRNSGIYIGYDEESDVWTVLQSSDGESSTNIIVEADAPISKLNYIGTKITNMSLEDKLLINNQGKFEDRTSLSGFSKPTSCRSVATGDFDNDMDVDLYLVCTLDVKNIPNIFYENLGNGIFKEVTSKTLEGSKLGIGDTVTTVDYDNDGFLDLFVTNGLGARPYSEDGPNQLFKNLGNENHWIEIDLLGTVSNFDGIGTRVIVTTGDVKQLREQTGGMHFRSQNHQRLHFGLGDNLIIQSIIIYWPSGIVHEIRDLSADQILKINEPTSPIPPKQQSSLNVKPTDVLCKQGLELIFQSENKVVCVKPITAIRLVERGWVQVN